MTAVYITLGVIGGLIAVILLVYLLILVRPRAKMPKDSPLLCHYAHRGLHGDGIPENSLAAFEKACEQGFGIELDIQLSKDGEVMVFHDYTLVRMTGKEGKLCDYTAAELKAMSLKDTNQNIPTFAEVLALVDGRVPILVELKGEDLNAALCPKAAALLRAYKGDYCIESFNPLLIRAMRKELPAVPYGQLYTNVVKDKKKASPLNILLTLMAFNFLARPDFIAYNHQYRSHFAVKLTTRFYRAARFVWTVREPAHMAQAREMREWSIFEHTRP